MAKEYPVSAERVEAARRLFIGYKELVDLETKWKKIGLDVNLPTQFLEDVIFDLLGFPSTDDFPEARDDFGIVDYILKDDSPKSLDGLLPTMFKHVEYFKKHGAEDPLKQP